VGFSGGESGGIVVSGRRVQHLKYRMGGAALLVFQPIFVTLASGGHTVGFTL
jgi:hypothetical protein